MIRNFELLCTMIPPPWCDGSLSSTSVSAACLRHNKNMVHLHLHLHLHLRAFVTTRPWFICFRSYYVLPLKTIHLHLGFSAPPTPTTNPTWFRCSYVPSLLPPPRDHDSVVTFICRRRYLSVHHLQLRPCEVLARFPSIWSYVHVQRLRFRPPEVTSMCSS